MVKTYLTRRAELKDKGGYIVLLLRESLGMRVIGVLSGDNGWKLCLSILQCRGCSGIDFFFEGGDC